MQKGCTHFQDIVEKATTYTYKYSRVRCAPGSNLTKSSPTGGKFPDDGMPTLTTISKYRQGHVCPSNLSERSGKRYSTLCLTPLRMGNSTGSRSEDRSHNLPKATYRLDGNCDGFVVLRRHLLLMGDLQLEGRSPPGPVVSNLTNRQHWSNIPISGIGSCHIGL